MARFRTVEEDDQRRNERFTFVEVAQGEKAIRVGMKHRPDGRVAGDTWHSPQSARRLSGALLAAAQHVETRELIEEMTGGGAADQGSGDGEGDGAGTASGAGNADGSGD